MIGNEIASFLPGASSFSAFISFLLHENSLTFRLPRPVLFFYFILEIAIQLLTGYFGLYLFVF